MPCNRRARGGGGRPGVGGRVVAAAGPEVRPPSVSPPQTIISVPVQTAVWPVRAVGAPVVEVGVQVSVDGL